MGRRYNSRYGNYVWLAALLVIAVAYQAMYSRHVLLTLAYTTQRVRQPFSLFENTPIVSNPADARQAGVRSGDRVIAINGHPFTGNAVLAEVLEKARPGDRLTVQVRRGDQGERSFDITLPPRTSDTLGPGAWALHLVLKIVMPVFCLLLGFWVATMRPRDPLAWLLLGLMLSFSQTATEFGWEGEFRKPAIAWHMLMGGLWPVWMLLFGIYFPEKSQWERRLPWFKWTLIIPITFFLIANMIAVIGAEISFARVAALNVWLRRFDPLAVALSMTAVGTFFANLGSKTGMANSPDARRRLMLLYTGSTVSLTPIFVLVLIGLFRGNPVDGFPEWVFIPALLLMLLFPLSMAYVIVVQRAMDVRMAVRQGLKYAFARSGVRVLQGAATVAIAWSIITLVQRPQSRTVDKTVVIGVGVTLGILMRRIGDRLRTWIDRRFFREAYNAELILSELSENVRTMVETQPLIETVTHRISESLHVPQVAALLKCNGDYRPAHALGFSGAPQVSFPEHTATIQQLRQTNQPARVYMDDEESWVNRAADGERDMLRTLDTQLLLPLSIKGKLLGFVSLGPKKSEEPYTGTDLKLLQSVATQTGLALENSQLTAVIAADAAQRERLNREIEIAREVQERLFPQTLPLIAGLDYCGLCRPAQAVGGDYYDFLALPEGKLGIAIGDVSGKGIAAALLMASLQASLRSQAISGPAELDILMRNVNRLVYEASASNRYATFFYGQYHPAALRLDYVNAGHNAPILFREGAGVTRLEDGGTVVGLLRNAPYRQSSVTLRPGDTLLLFTEGISEAMTVENEEWGEDRLMEAMKECDGLAAAKTIQRLLAAADTFAGGAKQHDDMTLVVVRVVG